MFCPFDDSLLQRDSLFHVLLGHKDMSHFLGAPASAPAPEFKIAI